MATTLSATALNIGYTQRKGEVNMVHSELSFSLKSGEVTALLGLNGAGKSTLLRTLCSFQPTLGGEVQLLGRPLTEYSPRELSRTIGVVLTEKSNCGGITVYDLVALGRHPYSGFFGELSPEDHTIIRESLSSVGIEEKAMDFVAQLSDGERQKVMIAKTLAQQCPIIILDEPTAFLDVISRVEVMVLLRRLASEQNKTILLSTHDLDMAIQMCDCLWLLEKGAPLYCGSPEDLILQGRLTRFFSRAKITFDPSTGRLTTPLAERKVGVTEQGDPLVSTWVINALTRANYQPCTVQCDQEYNYSTIHCTSPGAITVTSPGKEPITAGSISEATKLLG